MVQKRKYWVKKWRNMDRVELMIWSHLRLDRIEQHLGLDYQLPNLQKIADKLEQEATDKELYPNQSQESVFKQLFQKIRIPFYICSRHFINFLFRAQQRKCQDKSSNESKKITSKS